jgi:hypothetical protein
MFVLPLNFYYDSSMELSKEIIKRATGASLAVALGLGLTACSANSYGESDQSGTNQETEVQVGTSEYENITIEHSYTESGQRITTYSNFDDGFYGGGVTSNIGYCDGADLIEMPLMYYSDGGTSAITRSVRHSACLDGRLDESDFTLQ